MKFFVPIFVVAASSAAPIVQFGEASCDCCGDLCEVLDEWPNVTECQKTLPPTCSIQVIWNLETRNCSVGDVALIGTGGALTYEGYSLGVDSLNIKWTGMLTAPNVWCTQMGYTQTKDAVFEQDTCDAGFELPQMKEGLEYEFTVPTSESEGIVVGLEDVKGVRCIVALPTVGVSAIEMLAGSSEVDSAPAEIMLSMFFFALGATFLVL